MSPLIVIGALSGVIVLWAGLSFNRFVSQRQLLANSWANVETELLRRYDLIPNLVETVSGYADHERQALTDVIEARQGAIATTGSPLQQAGPENILVAGLRQLFAVSEAYPELMASGNFLDLQRQLVATENRIQASRRLFNGNVRDYNRRVESIPSRLIAAIARFSRSDYFEVGPAVRASNRSVETP